MVVFAQIFVKQWSWVLRQRGWLEMTSIYLTLVWFEGLFKDPDSRNNGMVQANITLLPNLVDLNGTLAKNLILDLLIFSASQVPQYHDLQINSGVEKTSRFITEKTKKGVKQWEFDKFWPIFKTKYKFGHIFWKIIRNSLKMLMKRCRRGTVRDCKFGRES